MKRFYKSVAVSDDLGILLDGRPVRTPARVPLVLIHDALAHAVAAEWAAQGEDIDPRSMPLTGLANAAIDRVAPDVAGFAAPLAAYGESELLCYRADSPDDLVARQAREWSPMLLWAQARYDVAFVVVEGIIHQPQPQATLTRLTDALCARSAWELAALNPIVTITGSLVLALAVLETAITPQDAFTTAHLDELWQGEQWGEDDWALATRAAHERDFLNACAFLALVRA